MPQEINSGLPSWHLAKLCLSVEHSSAPLLIVLAYFVEVGGTKVQSFSGAGGGLLGLSAQAELSGLHPYAHDLVTSLILKPLASLKQVVWVLVLGLHEVDGEEHFSSSFQTEFSHL